MKKDVKTKEEETLLKFQKFIAQNDLSFEVGVRNSQCTILAGYACHLGYTPESANILIEAIKKVSDIITTAVECEFKRVFEFAYCAGYETYWETAAAKKAYKF